MKLTETNLQTVPHGTSIVTFRNGKINDIHPLFNRDGEEAIMVSNIDYRTFKHFCEAFDHIDEMDFFLAADIRMPSSVTADIQEKLNGIEVKSRTCSQWFDELPEGTLKDAVLACKDEHLSNERKAIDIYGAIEMGCFLSDDEASIYLKRLIANMKALKA